jgi:hypothetical protein
VTGPPLGQRDRVLAGELLSTLRAVLDLAVAASSPSTDLDEALRLRRVARSQLDTAACLLSHVACADGIMGGSGAAAAGRSDVDPAGAAPLTSDGG